MLGVILFILLFYVFLRLTLGINKSAKCLVGKTAIVTGGGSGIGYQTCLDLASRGCRVIIADKIEDLESTRSKLMDESGNSNIECVRLDLASFKSIRSFAEEVKRKFDRLDILVNNAGILVSNCRLTENGFNDVWQVNHLGPFLLTNLLLDLLKMSAPSRIIFTSSISAHFHWNFDIENVRLRTPCDRTNAIGVYSETKLAVAIISHLLAKKLKDCDVTCNCLHPGCVTNTNIFYDNKRGNSIFARINWLIGPYVAKDPWEGAQTTIHLATSENLRNVTGQFFVDCIKFFQPIQLSNPKIARNVWKITEENSLHT